MWFLKKSGKFWILMVFFIRKQLTPLYDTQHPINVFLIKSASTTFTMAKICKTSLLCRLRADPSRCNSSNKQNSLIQQNHQHFWTIYANFCVLWDYGLMIFQCLFTIVKNWNIVLLLCLWHIDLLENLGKVRTSSHTLITRSHSTFRRDVSMV